jgi:hypothetical protein
VTAAAAPVVPARPAGLPAAHVDHVVVAAATLAEGAAWCEATLGVRPGPGGRHALFGTHNRLLKIESAAYPSAYLEIIAVDPEAPPPARPRWFGLDEAATRRRLAEKGPQLLHLVVRTSALDAQLAALAAQGLDAGVALAASRPTPEGLLQWRIAVRPDGRLLFGGAWPTLIEWPADAQTGRVLHPAAAMAASPVRLSDVTLAGLPPAAAATLGLTAVAFVAQSQDAAASDGTTAAGALRVGLEAPRGRVGLASPSWEPGAAGPAVPPGG